MRLSTEILKWIPGYLLDTLLPPRCPLCRSRIVSHGHLCGACWMELEPISDPMCIRCALPFAFASEGLVCGACLARSPGFDRAFAPVLYGGKGRDMVLALKYGNLFAMAPAMARMMAPRLRSAKEKLPDIIVPVPLHRWRMLARRFNQSQILAAALSGEIDVPLDTGSLVRTRATPSQGTLDRKKRFNNVRAAFTVLPDRTSRFEGRRVLLVDDVLTTGATASACAFALKSAGAADVGVAAFARAGHPVTG